MLRSDPNLGSWDQNRIGWDRNGDFRLGNIIKSVGIKMGSWGQNQKIVPASSKYFSRYVPRVRSTCIWLSQARKNQSVCLLVQYGMYRTVPSTTPKIASGPHKFKFQIVLSPSPPSGTWYCSFYVRTADPPRKLPIRRYHHYDIRPISEQFWDFESRSSFNYCLRKGFQYFFGSWWYVLSSS